MIQYIIEHTNGIKRYYAGSDHEVSNRWTQTPALATRWTNNESAVLFMRILGTYYTFVGILNVRGIQVPYIPDYTNI